MAGIMDALFGGKKKDKSGDAMNTLMDKPTPGGLGGTLSTADLAQARTAYDRYAIDADTSGGDRMTFEEFAQQWKSGKRP